MEECQLHPTAGRRYVHVFPGDPFLGEIRDCYREAALRMPWMSVDDLTNWSSNNHPNWYDERNVLIFWGVPPFDIPAARNAAAGLRYTESVGAAECLTEYQNGIISQTTKVAPELDFLIGGTQTVANFWYGIFRETFVAPIGYEPAVLGRPNWSSKKIFDVGFRGNPIGRRLWALKKLRRAFHKFSWIGAFGRKRKEALDLCLIDLYVGHSNEPSFPGMRLWQGISASSAIVTEPRDVWPAVKGKHCIEVPPIDHDLPHLFVGLLKELLQDQSKLRSISETAHRELSTYTIDRCMEEFVVPATKGLRG